VKTIFYTFFATIAAVTLSTALLWNSVLNSFGFEVIPLGRLHALHASQRKVDQMKEHHKNKRLKTTKKLTERSTKRVASTALASATIGTTAVVGTVIAFEIDAYCAEKKSLQDEANILDGTDIPFDFRQCATEAEQDTHVILTELKNSTNEKISNAINVATDYSAAKWSSVKEVTIHAMQSTGNASTMIWDKINSMQKNYNQ